MYIYAKNNKVISMAQALNTRDRGQRRTVHRYNITFTHRCNVTVIHRCNVTLLILAGQLKWPIKNAYRSKFYVNSIITEKWHIHIAYIQTKICNYILLKFSQTFKILLTILFFFLHICILFLYKSTLLTVFVTKSRF